MANTFFSIRNGIETIFPQDPFALIQTGIDLGAPFAKTATSRIHGDLFGSELATRSTDVIVFNVSNKNFTLDSNECDEGGFATGSFPDFAIQAKASTVYGMESHGFASGCACTVKYTSEDGTFFEITSRNPYIGKNAISQSHSPWLKLTPTKGGSNNNQVRWIIEDSNSAVIK